MTEELELMFKQYIKDHLRLNVQTQSVYTGGMDGSLYVDRHCVQLILDDEVISEVGL